MAGVDESCGHPDQVWLGSGKVQKSYTQMSKFDRQKDTDRRNEGQTEFAILYTEFAKAIRQKGSQSLAARKVASCETKYARAQCST